MNKSKIEWCDFSWNPVTGCLHTCDYCFARKQARRFCGDVRLNKGSEQLKHEKHNGHDIWTLDQPFRNYNNKVLPLPAGFEPTLHKYRLGMIRQKKKPGNIFVCATSDLFGEWVPDQWIQAVFNSCSAADYHNYLFLTKNPQRYREIEVLDTSNCWYGTSITCEEDMERYKCLPEGEYLHRYVGIKPIHNRLDSIKGNKDFFDKIDWVIIGAETGIQTTKVIPEKEWISDIVKECRKHKVPVFLKNNLQDVWGKKLIQEFPEDLIFRIANKLPKSKLHIYRLRADKICRECEKTIKAGESGWRLGGGSKYYNCESCYEERLKYE